MTIYILSIVIVLLSNWLTNKIINNEIENMGYVAKSEKTTKTSLGISIALNFVPYLNLVLSILNTVLCCIGLCNEKVFLEITKNRRRNIDDVIYQYEKNCIKKDVLKDAFVLDGASEKEIKEELKKIDSYTIFANKQKSGVGNYVEKYPTFNKKDFNKANAIKLAKEFLEEIETNTELTSKQKRQLLNLCKRDFLNEIECKKTNKSAKKLLKLVSKND